MSQSNTLINIFEEYLRPKYYNRLNYSNPDISILFNTFVCELHALIPADHLEAINEVKGLCDFITIVASSDAKINFPDQTIGLVYVDSKNQVLDDSIVIARLPFLLSVDLQRRKDFIIPFNYRLPFWLIVPVTINPSHTIPQTSNSIPDQDSQTAMTTIDKAISKYCSNNSYPRDDIKSYSQFIDMLAPDLFSMKLKVTDEQKIRSEAMALDKHVDVYPTLLLNSLTKLGLLA